MKIYVASSWRNAIQPEVVQRLRNERQIVYDFRNPTPNNHGFRWSEIDENWIQWNIPKYREALNHPIAESGFKLDYDAMKWADLCVLLMPCGRSAHLEAGYFVGAHKPLFILLPNDAEPELMYKLADRVCSSIDELLEAILEKKNLEKADLPSTFPRNASENPPLRALEANAKEESK